MKTKILGGEIMAFDGKEHVLIEKGEIVYGGSQIIYVGKVHDGKNELSI